MNRKSAAAAALAASPINPPAVDRTPEGRTPGRSATWRAVLQCHVLRFHNIWPC